MLSNILKKHVFIMDTGQMCNHIIVFGHAYSFCRENNLEPHSLNFCLSQYCHFNICTTKYCDKWWYLICKILTKTYALIPIIQFNSLDCNNKKNEDQIKNAWFSLINGWCIRHYDLFEKYLSEIISLFQFTDEVLKSVDNFLLSSEREEKTRIGLHIRRGDYKTWCNGRYYFDDEAFLNHLKHLLSIINQENTIVYICSNDQSLDLDYYVKSLPNIQFVFSQGSGVEDLCLLSKCDYIIGPPSTFSLVASMYGRAQLYWMKNHNGIFSFNDIMNFHKAFRVFDSYYTE